MLERAGARLWVSIVAAVIIFPAAAVLLLAAWAIRVQIAVPTRTEPSPVTLAAAPPISPVQENVRATVTEPVALPPKATEPSSTRPTPGGAPPADADRAQAALPSAPVQVEAAVPPPPATVAEPVAPAPDAKAPGPASASSLFATLAVVPPILGRGSPAYADPTQDTFSSVSPMAGKPAALEFSEPISGPVPLPKPKPHVTVAHVSRAVPLPRSRPELIR
jgi:hypothetical protein